MNRIAIAIALVPAILAGGAFAKDQAEEVSVKVRYDDLDLRNSAAVKRFDHRIDAAVDEVCGITPHRQTLVQQIANRRCTTDAFAMVTPQRDAVVARFRTMLPTVQIGLVDRQSIEGLKVAVRRR